jgi:hypothetical protein
MWAIWCKKEYVLVPRRLTGTEDVVCRWTARVQSEARVGRKRRRVMRTYVELIVVIGVFLLAAGPVGAAPTIDQLQPNAFVPMAVFAQGDLAQSFQQANNNVAGAGIFLLAGWGSTGDVTIALWDNLPNQGGNLLASGTATGTPGNWVDVFWAPVAVVTRTIPICEVRCTRTRVS